MISVWTMWLAPGSAVAGELRFTPDRPGVGDHTGTSGAGHAMIEGGVGVTSRPGSAGLAVVGRLGLLDAVEARLRLPAITVADTVTAGSVGIGAKVGGALATALSASVVPEVSLDPGSGQLGASVGANLALDLGVVGPWAHGSASWAGEQVAVLAGGGLGVPLGRGGAYVNAAYASADASFVGGGGWWGITDRLQIDAGVDVGVSGSAVVSVGASVGL